MTSAADIAAQQDEGLALLFQRGLELALQVQEDAMAATPEERARLAAAFQRLSRGVRQTAALRVKLAADAGRAAKAEGAEAAGHDKARVERRKGRLRAEVGRLIWTEAERLDLDPDDLKLELEEVLSAEAGDETFAAEPVEAQVARICRMLKIPSPLAGAGVGRSSTDEGSRGDAVEPSPAAAGPAQPLIRPADAAHLFSQGEKDHPDRDFWNSA